MNFALLFFFREETLDMLNANRLPDPVSPRYSYHRSINSLHKGVTGHRLAESQLTGKSKPIRLGLLVPFHGTDAIWGPSCQYSAVLAAVEINRSQKVFGREIELFAVDSGGSPEDVVQRCWELVLNHEIDALIGVHLSSVRVALREAFAGIIPYVFAPLYEGGETTPGVFAIGETPSQQFPAAIEWMIREKQSLNWHIVGNDYIWPRATHETVRQIIEAKGGNVVGEDYLSLGEVDISAMIQRIKASKPDVIFESLVGSDCVVFNRAFAEAGLAGKVLRLSGSIEENTLIGIGAPHTENLYCAASYFNSLATQENCTFMDRYRAAYGRSAPVQGVLSQSCYDAIHFFAALAERAGCLSIAALNKAFEGLTFHSVRGKQHILSGKPDPKIYLAVANGIDYEIVKCLNE